MKITIDLSMWRKTVDRIVAVLEKLVELLKRIRGADPVPEVAEDAEEKKVQYTDEEFADKVDYEGGIFSALQYGLRSADLADQNGDLAVRWRKLEAWWGEGKDAVDLVEQTLSEVSGY